MAQPHSHIQHILITGATSGIGKALALAAAKAEMAVTITGLEAQGDVADLLAELTAAGAPYLAYVQVDLSDAIAARATITDSAKAFGGLHMLVNNAGIQHVAPVEDFAPEAWDKVIAVNLSAAFHTMAAALPFMRQAGGGRIVNIASVHGLVASAQKAAYVAAKHGLIGLTKTVALETATDNITCNAICPGWVRTPLVEAQITARAHENGRTSEEEARLLVAEKQPSQQFVSPQEIADMALFLLSPSAGAITGSHFVMDGGWTAQ